jgi:hypothetical protein
MSRMCGATYPHPPPTRAFMVCTKTRYALLCLLMQFIPSSCHLRPSRLKHSQLKWLNIQNYYLSQATASRQLLLSELAIRRDTLIQTCEFENEQMGKVQPAQLICKFFSLFLSYWHTEIIHRVLSSNFDPLMTSELQQIDEMGRDLVNTHPYPMTQTSFARIITV